MHELRRTLVIVRQAAAEQPNLRQPGITNPDRKEGADQLRLQRWIEAAGGRLKVVAGVPEGDVVVTSFPGVEGHRQAGAATEPSHLGWKATWGRRPSNCRFRACCATGTGLTPLSPANPVSGSFGIDQAGSAALSEKRRTCDSIRRFDQQNCQFFSSIWSAPKILIRERTEDDGILFVHPPIDAMRLAIQVM